MLRLLLKITAILTGLGILVYLLKRNLKVWELEVVAPQPDHSEIKTPPPVQKPKQKKSTSGDDLKQIKGIGPALEQQLNAIGISTFQQIANLSPADIEKIEEQMNGFSGRIERDHWIEQAKALSK
jgi:predicted flap endonuclease-1-like 5' DNA nuclease